VAARSDAGAQLRPRPLNYFSGQSTITLAHQGFSGSGKSKHIAVRYFYVKQLIETDQLYVEYLPTERMIADILTKPIVGKKFIELRNLLLNIQG